MQKIQQNKITKRAMKKKKTVLNIIATNKVKRRNGAWTNSKIIGMQCMQELYFSARGVEVGHCSIRSKRETELQNFFLQIFNMFTF